jgi:hypothetical protein
VTIGLWEIPQHAAAQRVKLFSKQAYIIAAREKRGNQAISTCSAWHLNLMGRLWALRREGAQLARIKPPPLLFNSAV